MTGKISGVLFSDLNADGIFDGSDSGYSGDTVNLLASDGKTVVATTTTAADGSYSFASVAAGSYTVQFVKPTGAAFSPSGSGSTGTNSTVSSAGTAAVTVASGASTVNAGFYMPVTYSGTVFTDSNDDGQVDGADKGLGGVTVQLLGADGTTILATTTTAANGTYSFANLAPGTYSAHVVQISTPGAQFSPYGSNTTPQPVNATGSAENNLLTNGSFEPVGNTTLTNFTTVEGYAGWTSSANTASTPYGSGPGNGPEIALTNSANSYAVDPKGATNTYASDPGPDNANPNYTGGSGTHAAFFVDDGAIETISQSVTLQAGQAYEIGFDLLETKPGASNVGYFELDASVNGQVITTAGSVSGTILTPGVWTHFADLYTAATTGTYTLTFSYMSGVPGSTLTSKDVLVDDVYISAGQSTPNLTTTSEVNSGGYTTPVTLSSGQIVGNESAGVYLPPATISGNVFTDANADGAKQSTDAGIAGQTVNLSSSAGVVIATTVTDASGNYSFTNQAAGTYTVSIPPSGTVSPVGTSTTLTDSTVASNGTKSVTVANGATAIVNEGVYKPVSLSGTVFLDSNADGAKQGTESGIAGNTVNLIGADGHTVVATTTTAANGTYSFTGQTPGTYTVQVVTPAGDLVSPNGTSTTLTDSNVGAGDSQTVTLTSGTNATINAGLYPSATITGTVFTDANADGAKQTTDAGLGGQTVNLIGPDGHTVLATTTTAANGTYSFTGLAPGSDTVQVVAPAGDKFSPAGTSTTLLDSSVSSTGTTPVTVTPGTTATVNAGVFAPGIVTGTVFADANGDGAKQTTDAGIAGQTVTLIGPDGHTVLGTTTTAANGTYSFTGVTPGADSVVVTPASGSVFSPVGTSTTLPDSGVSIAGAAAATVTSGSTAAVNAGEYVPVSLTGNVFTDSNADGAKQAGDAGASGVTVGLVQNGAVIATTTTDASGNYSFAGLAPGFYSAQVTAPAGDMFSPVGTSTTLPDSSVSSTGATPTVTLTSGQTAAQLAGVYAPVAISGTVFADTNGDGAKQTTDAGLAGQTVNLIGPDGHTVVATTTTGANGTYNFAGVTPGSYTVQVVPPSGSAFSPAGTSTTLLDSGVSGSGTQSVTVTSGNGAVVNAGEYVPSTVSGTVFTDANADGAKQTTDAGLGGQTVNLIGPDGHTVLATTTTAANGAYSFTGVAPGADTIQVVPPAGDKFSPVGTSTTLPDSSVSSTGTTPVTVTSGSSSTVNAGVFAPGIVTGTVFADTNGDGAKQTADAGIAGQTVTLIGPDGHTVLGTTTTAANGTYSFTGVTPGADSVLVTPASGSVFSPVGTSTTLPDSGVSTAGAAAATVTSGSTATVNAGEYVPSTVSGTVFTDANADGAKQTTDAGLGGQTVNLIGPDGQTVLATATTAANGSYSFTGVAPGADTIQVVPPAGDKFSPPGTSTALPDSSVSATGTTPVTVTSGSNSTVNAGVYVPVAITGTVFADINGDGAKQTTDAGLAGQTVNLIGPDGHTVVATTTTGASGAYSFAGVTPGSYTVQVVPPAGSAFSPTGTSTTLLDSSVSGNGAQSVTVTSGNGAVVNAGEYVPSTVSGTVFDDANADGAKQTTESGLAGQTVNLIGPDGHTVLATATTAANGTYGFTGVAPGADTVQVVPAAGEAFSAPGTSTTLPDSTVSATGAKPITVTSGSSSTVNAGEFLPAKITGTVFTDANADGVKQASDTGAAGQTVNLIGQDGHTIIATTTTDLGGAYSFAGLLPGSYTVQAVPPAGDQFSPAGSSATLLDSTVSSAGAQSVTLAEGGAAVVNAGEYAPASLTGTVFNDPNADGAKEAGETGAAGVTVNLVGPDGHTVLATTTTNASGTYSFTGITPGADTVQVVAPAGEDFSPLGTSPTLIDSTVSPTGAQSVTFSSGSALQANAGVYLPGSITSHAFLDAHYDGLDDYGDPAFQGVTVKLYDGAGHYTGQSTVTDASGDYSFGNLAPGQYQVQFVAPAGTAFTTDRVGSDNTINSDANVTTSFSEVFSIAAGQNDNTHNVGLLLTGGYANAPTTYLNSTTTSAGSTGPAVIIGGSGPQNDTINGGQGNNILVGGDGSNVIESGTGNNIVLGGPGPYAQIQSLGANDFIFGGPGNDLIQAHDGNAYVAAGVGNQTIYGGSGTNTFIANQNSGTVSYSNGVFSNITAGDTFVDHGTTNSIYEQGDGVLFVAGFNPAAGDTIHIYGYSAPTAIGVSGGYEVLYFGPNAAVLLQATGGPITSQIAGITYSAALPATPLVSVSVDANNYLTLTPAGAAAPLIGPGLAPTITGAVAGQAVADNATVTPFSNLVIADPTAGQTETVTVSPFSQNGVFSHLGSGSVTNGVYSISGTSAAVTAALDALVFTPTAHQVAPGQTVTTNFTVTATDTAGYSRTDTTTSVVATAVDVAPTITGAASGQAVADTGSLSPFAHVTLGDIIANRTDTVTVTLSNAANGALSNLGNGSYNAATGVLTASGTAQALTAMLDQLVFTPTAHQAAAGSTVTTGFTVSVADPSGGSVTNAATSVVAMESAAPVAAPVSTGGTAALSQANPNYTGGDGATVVTGPGYDTVTLGNGNNSVNLGGYVNSVTVGNGNNTIQAGNGNDTIAAGNGTNTITAAGNNNTATVGTGNDTINIGNTAIIHAAGGNQTITLAGSGNMVFIGGSGASSVTGGSGSSQVTTTGGTATISLGGYGNIVTTGGANDTITDGAGYSHFMIGTQQGAGLQVINNFQTGSSLVDILYGAAGTTQTQLVNSLKAVAGGTELDIPNGGSVLFTGLQPNQLHVSNFQIG